MTPIEHLAHALHKAHYECGRGIAPPWPSDRFEQERWLFMARAAVEALMKCTDQIVTENLDSIEEGDGSAFCAMLRYVLEKAGGK